MSKVALSGGNGFLGWHTRVALKEQGVDGHRVAVGSSFDLDAAVAALDGADRFIHIAGVNRASEEEIRQGNVGFAEQIREALNRCQTPPRAVVYADSIHSGTPGAYGESKARAGEILAATAETVGSAFHGVRLPNLFGEHGRSEYNSVTATFCHQLAQGVEPVVQQDKDLTLLHAQNAADLLLGTVDLDEQAELEVQESVSGLLTRLRTMAAVYGRGEIPEIGEPFDRDLFNTYRSTTFPDQAPVHLTRHADDRGSFFEIIRSHGGTGQSSFSITHPGISRGDHFHRRKVERFTVLAGAATISLRKLFTDTIHDFQVTGDEPVSVDMPTGWAHRITNTGESDLYTSFWTNDLFDPHAPDTIPETV
ncbi:MAG: polysaccharide biosynthesis C-terminal domain-containing protein [Micrococcaceae bacterium]